jgi:hypothetical protein
LRNSFHSSCSGRAAAPSGAARTARDDKASTPCVGCRGITQPSSCITNTPLPPPWARGLVRASSPTGPTQAAGRHRHLGPPPLPPGYRWRNRWRSGRPSRNRSRCLSLRLRSHGHAARELAHRGYTPGGPWCPRRAPPRGYVRIRPKHFGGASAGTFGATLRTRKQRLSANPSKPERLEERPLTSRRRILTASSSRVRRTLLWHLSPPPRHSQTPPRHVLALPRCAPLLP